jgi:predicted acyl esterase
MLIDSPLETGLTFGEWCPYSGNGELPADQRPDDGRSVVFDTGPLDAPLEIVGAPLLDLAISIDDETALLSARLQDVHPDGASLNVSYGLLNVAQRNGSDHPLAFPAGARETVRLKLNDIAHRFPVGHRIRVALSTAFWPLAWPAARRRPVTLMTGQSQLILPVLADEDDLPMPRSFAPAATEESQAVIVRNSGGRNRQTREDPAMRSVEVEVERAKSCYIVRATGTEVAHQTHETFFITADEPNSARIENRSNWSLSRPGWDVRTKAVVTLASTENTFELSASMEAYESAALIGSRSFSFSIPRRLV